MRDWETKTIRLTLDLMPEEMQELDRLRDRLKTRTRSRLVRQALKFYSVLVDHRHEGYMIQAVKQGSLLQFPDLDVPYPKHVQLAPPPIRPTKKLGKRKPV